MRSIREVRATSIRLLGLLVLSASASMAFGNFGSSQATASSPNIRFGPLHVIPPGSFLLLSNVSCSSSVLCVASGGLYGRASGIFAVGRRTGGRWRWTTPREYAKGYGYLADLSCPSNTLCGGVGYTRGHVGGDGAVYWIGSVSSGVWKWTRSSVIGYDSSPGGGPTSVSCANPTSCVAVGSDGNNQAIVSTYTDSGGTWLSTPMTPVTSDSTGKGVFTGVSCASSTSCVAVGSDGNGQGIFSFGTMSGGAWTWSAAAAVVPDNASGTTAQSAAGFEDVSCATASSCVAVGYDVDGRPMFSTGLLLGGVWTWSAETPINVATNSKYGGSDAVSCVDASSVWCVITGSSGGKPFYLSGALIARDWTWSSVAHVVLHNQGGLPDVSCTKGESCVAVSVGGYILASRP